MARVTVERTLDKVDSRFELVVLTAYRAHAIYCGSQTLVNASDKYAILALREVESGKLDIEKLRDTVIRKYAIEGKTTTSQHSFVSNDFSFDEADAENENKIAISSEANGESDDKEVPLSVGANFFGDDETENASK